jgi:ribonuclease HI
MLFIKWRLALKVLEKIVVHSDGGCRNNPGQGAWGYVVHFEGVDRKLTQGGYVEHATNNFLEYCGLAEAAGFLLRVDELGPEIQFLSDSMLVVRTLNGVWQIKEPSLRDVYNLALSRLAKLQQRVHKLSIGWIKRDLNVEADAECNRIMDLHGVVGVAKPRRAAFLKT